MNIDIISKITEYFENILDTIYISNINKDIYLNRKNLILNNTYFYNTNEYIPFFTKYNYKYIDIESCLILELEQICKKLGIKVINTLNELLNINNLKFNEIYINFNSDINFMDINLNNVKGIRFNKHFCCKVFNLPNHINKLYFGNQYRQKFYYDLLPGKLEFLKLGDSYDYNILHLPESLKYLIIGNRFNNKIDILNNLNLKYLEIGNEFDKTLYIPDNLTTLKLGNKFNEALNINENLIKLKFGYNFNNYVNFDKNNKLRYLYFGPKFNNNLTNLPDSIISLYLPNYNKKISYIPANIQNIHISKENLKEIFAVEDIIKLKYKLFTTYGSKIIIQLYDNLIHIK